MSVTSHDFPQIKDTHYLTHWSSKDLLTLRKMSAKIRTLPVGSKKDELISDFYSLMDKRWDDHRNLPVEAEQVSKTEDILTWKGVAKFCRLITRKDNNTFTTVAIGTGTSTPKPFDERLVNEVSWVNMTTSGFFEPSGITVRYAGIFGETIPTNHYTESLVRDQSGANGATVACRNTFVQNYIDHTVGNGGVIAAGLWEFIIVI